MPNLLRLESLFPRLAETVLLWSRRNVGSFFYFELASDVAKQALLVIDYIESCCLERYERPEWGCTFSAVREMSSNLEELIDFYRVSLIGEVIWITCCPWVKGRVHPNIEKLYSSNPEAEFYTDGTGANRFYRISPTSQEQVVEKNLYSAFSGSQGKLKSYLEAKKIEHLIITGVYSTGCVNATICEAFHHGYTLSIVKDCVETFDRPSSQEFQSMLFEDWQYMYGELVSKKELMAV